jgi:hypothetical protein
MPEPKSVIEIMGDTIFSDRHVRNDGHVCLDEETRKKIVKETAVRLNEELLNDKRLCLIDVYIIANTIADAVKTTMINKVGPTNIAQRGDEIAKTLDEATVQSTAQPKADDN